MDKVGQRFVGEMVYGIQASKDVKVSEVARALNEGIALIKTENRLCRNLASEDLTERVNAWTSWDGGSAVSEDTVLAIDLGDIRKSYAKNRHASVPEMEYLGHVRDGSSGEIVPGYWLCEVVGADVEGERITPLYGALYAQKAEAFQSENDQIHEAIDTVIESVGQKGIWAIDRGGDRRKIIIPLLDKGLRFVIRQDGDRHILLPGGKKCSVEEAARWCKGSLEKTVEVEREGYTEKKHLTLGSLKISLPERPEAPLYLVVIRGLAPHPIWLLTNVAPVAGKPHAEGIAEIYLTRWKCEETYRFIKQSYHLEDVRVRSYTALRNTYALVHAVLYFVTVVVGQKAKLNLIFKKVCEKAKRFYAISTFFQYALADGIHRLLFESRSGPKEPPPEQSNGQRAFEFPRPLY